MTPDWALLTKNLPPAANAGTGYEGRRLDCGADMLTIDKTGYDLVAMQQGQSPTGLGIIFSDSGQTPIERILTFRNSQLTLLASDTGAQTTRHDIDLLFLKGGMMIIRPSDPHEALPLGRLQSVTLGEETTLSAAAWAGRHQDALMVPVLSLPRGTPLETGRGRITIEKLNAGDMVVTPAGAVAVKMVSLKPVDTADVMRPDCNEWWLPPADAGGGRAPAMPSHQKLRRASISDSNISDREFARADLLCKESVAAPQGLQVNVLLAEACVIEMQGIELSTLLPARLAKTAFTEEARSTLLQTYPALGETSSASQGPLARKVISDEMAQKLIAAHLAANKAFFDDD